VLAVHREMRARDGFSFLLGYVGQPFAEVVEHHRLCALGQDLPPGLVPATFLVAEVDGELVGRTSIRHELNPDLEREGGHIGYGVVPAHRGRGWATEILRQSLIVARALGVDRALLTCDDDNLASARVIERNGGVLADRVDILGSLIRRYWID